MKGKYLLLIICTLALFSLKSCLNTDKNTTPPTILLEDILSPLQELSQDEYEGRKPFSKGETKTINYLQDELKKIGLLPANNDSYFQDVPLIEITGKPAKTMEINGKKPLIWESGKDFVIHTEGNEKINDLDNSELVFCGFGITSEKDNWSDYAGMDMKGKTAVILVNDPGFGGEDSTFFKGNEMTYYGRWTYKYEEADRQGLAGLLMIHETSSAGYPWFVVQSSWSGSQLAIKKEEDAADCPIKGWISLEKAKELFATNGLDIGEQIRNARKPGFRPVPLHATVSTSIANTFHEDISKNVVGYIKGSKYPDEYIVYTAHWDHIGIGSPVDGDSIYNGALDNASGTAAVLAIAKAFQSTEKSPERSVVFLFVTAEEQGLLGSEYYVENPLFPLNKTVCNLNMDGVNPLGKMKDFTITGWGHSEMDQWAEKHATKQNRYILPDQDPSKGYFFRSDHFNFAKKGIPPLYGGGDYEHDELGIEYIKTKKEEYIAKRYHAPSDEYDQESWNTEGLMQDATLFLHVGWDLANSRDWPQWNSSSEFSR